MPLDGRVLGFRCELALCSAGSSDCALLLYRFTGEKEVELMSTFVPEAFRGRGVAALLTQVTRTSRSRWFKTTAF